LPAKGIINLASNGIRWSVSGGVAAISASGQICICIRLERLFFEGRFGERWDGKRSNLILGNGSN